jgi:hypothetical protein
LAALFVPLPSKTTRVTPPRFWPVIFAVDPPWIRLLVAQLPTHATLATLGCATYVAPPDEAAAVGAIAIANASPSAYVRVPRMSPALSCQAYGVS